VPGGVLLPIQRQIYDSLPGRGGSWRYAMNGIGYDKKSYGRGVTEATKIAHATSKAIAQQ
jgi:hypothetical protein